MIVIIFFTSSMKGYTSLRCYEYVLADPWENGEVIHELPALVQDENPSQFPVLQEEDQKAKEWCDKVEDRVQVISSLCKS